MAEVRSIPTSGEISHVALSGRLDIEGVGVVEIPLTAATVARRKPAIIDMSGVEFLGSLGIGLLVRCAVSLQRAGSRLVLYACQPMVLKSLEITKVSSVVSVAESEAAALELLARS